MGRVNVQQIDRFAIGIRTYFGPEPTKSPIAPTAPVGIELTVLVAVSNVRTPFAVATSTSVPSAGTATPCTAPPVAPSATVAETVLVTGSMTETLLPVER